MFGAMTFVGVIASFFLPWYDDPSNYPAVYGTEDIFELLISCIRWITVASGLLTAILAITASRVEPRTEVATTLG